MRDSYKGHLDGKEINLPLYTIRDLLNERHVLTRPLKWDRKKEEWRDYHELDRKRLVFTYPWGPWRGRTARERRLFNEVLFRQKDFDVEVVAFRHKYQGVISLITVSVDHESVRRVAKEIALDAYRCYNGIEIEMTHKDDPSAGEYLERVSSASGEEIERKWPLSDRIANWVRRVLGLSSNPEI